MWRMAKQPWSWHTRAVSGLASVEAKQLLSVGAVRWMGGSDESETVSYVALLGGVANPCVVFW